MGSARWSNSLAATTHNSYRLFRFTLNGNLQDSRAGSSRLEALNQTRALPLTPQKYAKATEKSRFSESFFFFFSGRSSLNSSPGGKALHVRQTVHPPFQESGEFDRSTREAGVMQCTDKLNVRRTAFQPREVLDRLNIVRCARQLVVGSSHVFERRQRREDALRKRRELVALQGAVEK